MVSKNDKNLLDHIYTYTHTQNVINLSLSVVTSKL